MPVVVGINSWAISFVVSVIYLGIFLRISKSKDSENDGLLFGFCISGLPAAPNRLQGCHGDVRNSHAASFVLDAAMGGAVYYLYQRLLRQKQVNDEAPLNPQITLYFGAMGCVILLHGCLHLVMSEMFNCYMAPDNIPTWIKALGYMIVAVYSFILCFVILGMSFARNGRQGWTLVFVASLVLTGIVLALMMDRGLEWILPSLFSVSHPLSCVAALCSKSPLFTQAMGWTFCIASVMGICEMTQCDNFYRSLGGHVMYDFWLHVTVLLCLPPFAPLVAPLAVKP